MDVFSRSSLRLLGKVWSVLFLLILLVVFSIQGASFFDVYSLQNALLASTLIMLVGIGETFVVLSGGIDISPAYVVGLSGTVGAIIMREMHAVHAEPSLIVLVGCIGGLIFSLLPGLVNGIIITKMKVPPLIVTLGTMAIAEGAVLLSNNGAPVVGLPMVVGKVGNAYLLYYHSALHRLSFLVPSGQAESGNIIGILPIPVLILGVVVLITHLVLSRTIFGQHIYAIGGNVNASRAAGIPVNKVLVKTYMVASLMYGVAGMIYVLRFSSSSPNMGEPLLLSSIGAVFIGGASMAGGYGTIVGTVVGALIIAVLQSGLVMLAVSPFWQYVAVGCVIILAVFFDQFKTKWLLE
jgi:ribose transport system permease protein